MAERFEDQTREPAFDAVIPAPVRHNQDLCANAKLVYGEIRSLADNYGYCWASNRFFADLYKLTERSVARIIKQLAALKFVNIKILRDKQGHVSGRRIYIGCGFPEQENDTLSHMTKKSDHMTKMSCQTDKNVSQDINKNIITKKGDACAPAREKPLIDAEAREQFKRWAKETFGEAAELDLIDALMAFCDSRLHPTKEGKKSNPVPPGRAVKTITNKLIRFSNGRLPVVIALLDKAIERCWDTVFALEEDEIADAIGRAGQIADDEEAEGKWVD